MSRKNLLLGLIIILALAGWLAAWLFYPLFNPQTRKATQVISQFFQLTSANNLTDAYALTSKEFQQNLEFDAFQKVITDFPGEYTEALYPKIFKLDSTTINSQKIYRVGGDIFYNDFSKGFFQASLVEDNSQFNINSLKVSASGSRAKKFNQTSFSPTLGI